MASLNPINYRITVEPDLERFTFRGRTEILIEATKPVNQVSLDALELAFSGCLVRLGSRSVACSFRVDRKNERVTILLPNDTVGRFSVTLQYTGLIGDNMAGFYRSRIVREGKEEYIAVTQFQERDARRAFPCFDCPSKKATFDVEMIVDDGLTALSNGPVVEEKPSGAGKKLLRFGRTPKMSTYLLFFGVGRFETIQESNHVVVRVVSVPGRAKHGSFGLEFGRKSLAFCEDYYRIPFPLPKLDLIAVPDFAFGAMENWGAITFRENLLLYHPHLTSKEGLERICEVIAHEIAHQWFGNLVSPSDWRYLWLNESFATYFAYGVVHHFYPEWEIWDQFLQNQTDPALERDGLRETLPIELPSGGRVAITAGTAPIIYNKGGSILRQVEGYIGTNLLKKGLRNYLKNHAYGCAASHHLWEVLEAASEKPVTRMMQSWIEQPGYPILDVDRRGDELTITQRRFTYLPEESEQNWMIPVSIRLFPKRGRSRSLVLLLDGPCQSIPIGSGILAYKVNDRQTGFYRVRYRDRAALDALGERVSAGDLAVEDRWGLQNDLYALVERGDVSLDDYLAFLSHYKNEDAYLPLISIAGHLSRAFLITGRARRKEIASIGRSLFERALPRIGLNPQAGERHGRTILRERLLWHAVLYGSKRIEEFVRARFESLARGGPVHPDLQKSAMQVGAFIDPEKAFAWFEERLRSSESEHERINVLAALGCFKDGTLIDKVREYVLNKVPNRNRFVPIVSLASNPYAVPSMWDWYVSHVHELERLHPTHYERLIVAIVPVAGIGREREVKAFFDEYVKKRHSARDVVAMSLERLEIYSRMHGS